MRHSRNPVPSQRRLIVGSVLAASCTVLFAAAAGAGDIVDIVQKRRAFSVPEVTVERGSSLRFINADDFPHQIHMAGPGVNTDSALQPPGAMLAVAFPTEGTFEVTCGVHPRMHMTVTVKSLVTQ